MSNCIHGKPLNEHCSDCYAEENAPATAADWPMRYDIATDTMMPVSQKDWNEVMDFVHKSTQARALLAIPDEESSQTWRFQLAIFPMPMAPAKAFIAEAKAIEPYPALQYKGETYFPPVPKTPWIINAVSLEFAAEIVRRWNRVPGQY